MTRHTALKNLIMLRNIRIHESALRSEALAVAGRRMAQFIKQLRNALRARRQIAALAALDDRTLKDIGLSRGEVHDVMRKPFWAFKPLKPKYRRRPAERSLNALASLSDNHLCNLSEAGQRLRREAQRPR
jgi:uncharacterized protein YjiS (DUF1127 family)